MTATRRTGSRRPSSSSRDPKPLIVGGLVLAVVVIVGLVIAFSPGTDSDDSADDSLVFAPVSVEGDALPDFADAANDPAVGLAAPRLTGETPDGARIAVEPGEPTLLVFLAHWCPHCQAEVPVIVDLASQGGLDGVRLVGVLTGTNEDAPNFPPAPWLEEEGWPGEVLVDDESFSAGGAYGLTSYPYLVALDADGNVVARSSGEVPPAGIEAMAQRAIG